MRNFALILLSLIGLMAGCVSDEENSQIIHDNNLKEIEKYLTENNLNSVKEFKDPGTGIVIVWQEVSGSGMVPETGDTLKVDYVGKLVTDKVFDTSIEAVAKDNNIFNPNRPYSPLELRFGYGQVIPGFEFALSKMELGDEATVLMPSLYGYGAEPIPGIPSNSVLIFKIDLLEINGEQHESE